MGGAFYCGWLCPLGTIQEWLGSLGRRILGGKNFRMPPRVEHILMFLRYLLLIAGLTGVIAFTYYFDEPYISFTSILEGNTSYLTTFSVTSLVFFLILALFVDRPFCRYFCTQGAQYGALSLGRLLSIRRHAVNCIDCKLCDKACPTQVMVSNKHHVRHFQCINCMKCISACPAPGALDYGWAVGGSKEVITKEEKSNE